MIERKVTMKMKFLFAIACGFLVLLLCAGPVAGVGIGSVGSASLTAPTVSPDDSVNSPHQILPRSSDSSTSGGGMELWCVIGGVVVVIVIGTICALYKAKSAKKRQIVETPVSHAQTQSEQRPAGDSSSTGSTQQEIHYHINSENFYAGDVGIVASDNAIVNRATITNESVKKCPQCGAELKDDDKFCGKCGRPL